MACPGPLQIPFSHTTTESKRVSLTQNGHCTLDGTVPICMSELVRRVRPEFPVRIVVQAIHVTVQPDQYQFVDMDAYPLPG